ncbi:RING-type domain-containing protein [Forsythia ovata]|uniref:RING-type domain-containing protein n=1 Tax=Forsythia ovata TaxID=205694 RepID=A0ABD1SRS8_9LAMI
MAVMVVITEEIHGVHVRVFKWNEKLPETMNKKGFFLLRVYDEISTVTWNGTRHGTNIEFAMHPDLLSFDLFNLSCHCRILRFFNASILSPEFFSPEHIESLTKTMVMGILRYFRFKRQTLIGNGSKPVIAVEIYRHKTVDHTKEHVSNEDSKDDNEEYDEEIPLHICENLANIEGETETSSMEIESAHDCAVSNQEQADSTADVVNQVNQNEIADILRILKSLLGISGIEVLEQIQSNEPKCLYEVKHVVVCKDFQDCDLVLEDRCSICLQRFSEEIEMEVRARAQGKIILASEHAMVHGSIVVAASIDLYCLRLSLASTRLLVRAGNIWSQIEATFNQMDTTGMDLECFQVLKKQKLLVATHRISNLWEEVQKFSEFYRSAMVTYYKNAYLKAKKQEEIVVKNHACKIAEAEAAVNQIVTSNLETPETLAFLDEENSMPVDTRPDEIQSQQMDAVQEHGGSL